MTDRKTTFKIGFESDLAGLKRVNEEVGRLTQVFERLAGSVGAASDKIGGLENKGAGLPAVAASPVPATIPSSIPVRARRSRDQVPRGMMDVIRQHIPTPVRGVTRAVGAGVRGVAGGLGLGAMAGMLGGAGLAVGGAMYFARGIMEAKDYRLALDGVYKQLHLSRDAQAKFSERLEKTSKTLGMTRSELAPLERSYISLAGAIQGVDEIQGQVQVAGNLARGLGMDVSQALPQFGQLAQSGVFGRHAGEDGLNVRDFATVLADSISRGEMKGREGELIQSVQSLVGVQMQMLTRPQNVVGMLDTMTAMNQTGDPGLTGARGAQLLAQVAAGIRNPGAGAFGEFTAYQAFGGGDYYEFQKRKEEGAFGESNNLGAMLGHFQKTMPDANARHYGMSKLLGISMHQAEALERGYSKLNMGGKERTAFIDTLRDVAGGGEEGREKLERLDFAKLPLLAELHKAESPEQLRNLLSEERIGMDEKKINEIMSAEDPQRKALEEVMSMNLKLTEGESVQKSVAELKDINSGISDTLLQNIVPLLERVSGALATIREVVSGIGKIFGVTEKSKGEQQQYDPEGHDVLTGERAPRMIETENGLVPDPVDVMINEHLSGKAPVPVERPVAAKIPAKRSPIIRHLPDEVDAALAGGADKRASAAPVFNHTSNIYLDGMKRATVQTRAVGNGSASKTMVPAY